MQSPHSIRLRENGDQHKSKDVTCSGVCYRSSDRGCSRSKSFERMLKHCVLLITVLASGPGWRPSIPNRYMLQRPSCHRYWLSVQCRHTVLRCHRCHGHQFVGRSSIAEKLQAFPPHRLQLWRYFTLLIIATSMHRSSECWLQSVFVQAMFSLPTIQHTASSWACRWLHQRSVIFKEIMNWLQ